MNPHFTPQTRPVGRCAPVALCLTCILAVWFPVLVHAGYLEEGAPPPLQWQPPRLFSWAALATLPPLNMGTDSGATLTESTTNAPAASTDTASVTAKSSTTTKAGETPKPALTDTILQLLTPVPGTNHLTPPILPMSFVPPAPPSSTAVYTREKP